MRLTDATVGDRAASFIVVDADDGTKYEHKGLSASTTVHYWVIAVNSAGAATVASNPATATTKSMPTLGPAPRNLRGVPSGVEFITAGQTDSGDIDMGTVNLYWNVPTGTSPADTDIYTVEYSLTGQNPWISIGGTPPMHDAAFGTAVTIPATHTIPVGGAADIESAKSLYYRVKVGNSNWSTKVRVNLVADDKRPDSLAWGPGSTTPRTNACAYRESSCRCR